MKQYVKFFLLLFSFSFFCYCSNDDDPISNGEDDGKFKTNPDLDDLWEKVRKNSDGIESREIFKFLLEATACNWEQEKLQVALENVTALQFREESDSYYGNFLFEKGPRPSSIDENAAQFCMEQGALLRMYYYDKLDDSNKKLLDELIHLSLIAIRRHMVSVSYTNIYVMKTWNLIALGETLGDKEIAAEGYEMLKTWLKEISQNGIAEYNSPTYSGVAATILGCLARHTVDENIKKEAAVALEFYSLYLMGNYFKTGMYLGGAHSRDYNYVSSRGNVDQMMNGIIKGYEVSFYDQHAIWTPTDQAMNLLEKYPRLLGYKFGTDEQKNVISYLTEKYNISSAGATYGADDKNLIINLASSKNPLVVNISSVVEGRSDPYGENKMTTSEGHSKPRHLSDYLWVRAQRNNECVVILAADGKERGDTEKLCAHVLFPASKIDQLWNGNTQIKEWGNGSPAEQDLTNEKTFFIRFEDVAVGIRYLYAKDVNGKDAPLKIVDQKKVLLPDKLCIFLHNFLQLNLLRPELLRCGGG